MPQLTNMPVVSLKNVSVNAGALRILENISLEIPRGRIVTLIGPNGAGKTTLLKVVLGIISPSSGTIEKADGVKTGYVPQKFQIPLSVPMTVKRFLSLNTEHPNEKKQAVMAETGISHLMRRQIHHLSGGEMQRLLLARVLLEDPDLLVLDEPAQGLDPVGEENFYALIDSINKERGCAILMVSHDLHVVMAKTDQVICINKHICCSGKPDEIISLPGYASLFNGSHSHLALYNHKHDHTHENSGEYNCVD